MMSEKHGGKLIMLGWVLVVVFSREKSIIALWKKLSLNF